MEVVVAFVAPLIQAHAIWLVPVVVVLYALSEALPYFPNVQANNTVQMVTNILKLLKEKLSLKPAVEEEAPKQE